MNFQKKEKYFFPPFFLLHPYWSNNNCLKTQWCNKDLISELHYEYYCEYLGLHPEDYYDFCIVNQLTPFEILQKIRRLQIFSKNNTFFH